MIGAHYILAFFSGILYISQDVHLFRRRPSIIQLMIPNIFYEGGNAEACRRFADCIACLCVGRVAILSNVQL